MRSDLHNAASLTRNSFVSILPRHKQLKRSVNRPAGLHFCLVTNVFVAEKRPQICTVSRQNAWNTGQTTVTLDMLLILDELVKSGLFDTGGLVLWEIGWKSWLEDGCGSDGSLSRRHLFHD